MLPPTELALPMTLSPTPPILFVVFNRPDKTRQSFEVIRAARPARLYVAADGPREARDGEAALCEAVRAITEDVDWPCEVHRLYRDSNLGCGRGVSGAITWFFENEEAGIILEDDITPDPSFFPFAAEMLARYADDPTVFAVQASHHLGDEVATADDGPSYFATEYMSVWGWATWARAWAHYEFDGPDMSDRAVRAVLERRTTEPSFVYHFWRVLGKTWAGKIDTWDFQWQWTIWRHDARVIAPRVNLMDNIGMDGGTHFADQPGAVLGRSVHAMPFPLQHPDNLDPVPALEARARQIGLEIRTRTGLSALRAKLRMWLGKP
ncbi:MAG: hypothetical protein AAFO93_09650 [Pseudomonadota bacterium]